MLYGSSSNDKGGIFRVSTNNTGFQLLHAFTGGANDGACPAQIMEASNGMLYGVCTNGGLGASPGNGVLFSMNKDGTGYSVLHRFAGFPATASMPLFAPQRPAMASSTAAPRKTVMEVMGCFIVSIKMVALSPSPPSAEKLEAMDRHRSTT